jgi:hypothetical protein
MCLDINLAVLDPDVHSQTHTTRPPVLGVVVVLLDVLVQR